MKTNFITTKEEHTYMLCFLLQVGVYNVSIRIIIMCV